MGKFQEQSEEMQERINEILMDKKLSVIVEGEHDILAYEIFFDEDNSLGLSPEQAQLLQRWSRLSENDKRLIQELIESLNRKNVKLKEKN